MIVCDLDGIIGGCRTLTGNNDRATVGITVGICERQIGVMHSPDDDTGCRHFVELDPAMETQLAPGSQHIVDCEHCPWL